MAFDKPMEYIATNIGIEVNLFETALAQKATPRFLIISSGSLYAATAALPLSEASLVTPSSPYAVSKLGQETMAQYYIQRGFECIIARPFNHFGPGQGPGFIVPDIAEQVVAVEQGKADTVLVGNLDAQRDYTDVRDITRAYRLLLEKGKSGEIYNICSGTARSGHEVLASILECSTTKPSIQEDPSKMRPADNPVVYADHKKITEDTGWEPEIALDSSIADVMADWRNRS
jgi:GDP-4-dehydro-6-deoxy-D-mannose reductase